MNSNTSNQALDLSGFGTKVEPAAKPVAAPVAMDFSSFGTRVEDAGSDAEDKGFLGRRIDDARRGWNRAMQGQGTIDAENAVRRIQEFDQIDDGTFDPSNYYDRELWMYKSGDEAMRAKLRQSQQSVMSESFGRISDAENTISQLPQSEAVQKFGGAETFGDAWDALVESPVEVISSLATESLGQQSPTLPLIALNPALGAGAGSFATEYGADIVNSLRESGVDFSSKENISAGLSDPDRMAAFREHANRRGLAIGLVDAISGGLAGKFAAGAKSTLGKIGRGATEDLVMQPALGAAGEAAGALAAGDEISAKDMLAEAAGEIGPGAVETAVGTYRNSRAAGIDDTEVTPGTAEVEQVPAETLMLTGPDQSVPQLPPSETTYGDGFAMTEAAPGTAEAGPAALPSPDQYGRAYGEGFVAGNDLPTPSPGPDYVAMVDRTGNQIGWFNPNTAHAVGKDLGSFEAPRRSTPSINDLLSDGRSADEIRAELVAQRQDERKNSDVGSVVRIKLGGQKRAQDVRVVGFTPNGAIVETRDGATVPVDTNQIPVPEQLNLDLAPAQEIQNQRVSAEIERAASLVESPTEAQAEAGNYRKGHVKVNGLDIAIETPRGGQRTGTDPNGRAWSVEMPAHYGYIKRTTGADGDHVDVYVGPEPDSDQVFVIDQIDHNTGKFDEHKVMIGYPSSGAAQADYRKAFSDGRAMLRLGAITPMSMSDFKVWIKDGNTKKPLTYMDNTDVDLSNINHSDQTPEQSAQPSQKNQNKGEPSTMPEKIEDFGEVLAGARKHYAELLKDAKLLDIAEVPLSQSWPQPDYNKMLEDGIDTDVVAFIHAARDEIPNKPKKSWKLKGWVSQVEQLRSFADELVSGEITVQALREKLAEKERSSMLFADLRGRMDLYKAVGHDQSLKGIHVSHGLYSMIDSVRYDPPKSIWAVAKDVRTTAFGNWPRQLATGTTREEAIANFKDAYPKLKLADQKKETSFTIYSYRRGPKSGKVWIGKKIGRHTVDLKYFDNSKQARAYLAENQDELVKLLNTYKDIPDHRTENNSPRVGVDHRNGADVTPEQFSETFGFRGVQFGNYVENSRRQQDLNQTYDSLMDLAGVLDVSPKALSLNGELGLAFGARGKGGKRAALAHYEPGNVVINLTKNKGAGSLAHEWWHALDNYFERKRGKTGYMTEKPHQGYQDPTRPAMIEAFASIKQAIDSTGISKRAQELDNRRSKQYWTTGREMSARSFESYIIAKLQDQGAANDYLANVVPQDAYGLPEGYPYPLADELPAIRAAFDTFFDAIEQRETDKGVELYSLRQHPARLISVTGTEMGAWKTLGQLRRKAAKHLSDLRGTSIKNADTGLELRITDRGIKHTLSGAGPELLQAVGKIKDIIRVATLVGTEADKRGRPEIKAVHKFETDLNISDQKFVAHVTGYETTDGAIFYDLALGKRGKGASASGTEIKDQVRNRITGQTPRSDNVIPDRSEIQSEKRRTLEAAVVTEIKRLAPAANIQTRETGQTLVGGKWAEGGYIPVDDLIWTAMDAANPEHVARHEIIHHLRATGRITETEWNTLQRKAKSTWRNQYRVDEYRDQYKGAPDIETVLDEEAVAEAFADWVDGKGDAKGGIARIFRKIMEFFDRIASVVRGQGYQTAEDVFRSIDAGEVGARAAQTMDQMKQQRDEYFAIAGLGKRKAATATNTKPQQKPSPLTKEQEAAIKRTMANIEDEAPVGVRIRETISDSVDYLKRGAIQHIFDQFDSIKRYEKATYGELKRASMSAYKMARLTTNLQSTMAAVLRHGPLEYKNGAFQVRKGFDGGFEAIFADLADRGLLKAWKGWAVANRAKRLAAEGRENNMTARDIALLSDLDKQYPEFRDVLKRWTEFNGAMLDMAEETGLLDPEARALFESDDYVPFYRAMDDRPTGPFNKRGIANQRSGINRLRGGEAEVNDLIDNMVRNMTHLVDASMKNVAAKRVLKTIKTAGLDDGSVIMKVPHDAVPVSVTPEQAAQALEDIGVQVQGMTRQQHDQWLKLFTLRPPKDPDVVSVMVGGKPQYFRVNDPLLLASMTSLGTERVHWLISILGYPKRWLTTGVTATPGFMLRNFIRDSLHGWVVSGENFTPGIDGFKGAIRSYREDTALVNIMAAGGGSGGFFRTQSRDVAKMLSKTKGKATLIDSPKMAWEWWKRVGQATENANRLAIYDSVLKDTGDVAEAAFQALDIMDFSMRGDSAVIRFLIGTIPFLNARMQGLYRLGRGAKENPKAFMLRGGLITAATMLLYGLNADDDRYDELPEWEKDAYYHIFLDNIFPDSALEAAGIDAKEWHIRMPKPFEVGALFSTIPERVTRLAQGKDDIGKYGERMWSMMRDTFAVDMPQFVKPLMEQWANETTFTGSPIVPERMKDLKPEAQYDARTSELAKQIGAALPDFMGNAKSPKRIDAAVRAYFGSYGVYVMGIADEVLDPIVGNPVEPELRGDQLPELGSFVRQQPYMSTRFVSEFYDMKSEIEALAKTYKQFQSQGQIDDAKELLERDNKKIAMAGWMRRKANQMSGINKDIRAIEESRSMTAAQKRERIDQLADQRNEFAKQVVTQLNKAGIK